MKRPDNQSNKILENKIKKLERKIKALEEQNKFLASELEKYINKEEQGGYFNYDYYLNDGTIDYVR